MGTISSLSLITAAIILSGAVGAMLDVYKISNPAGSWFLGAITGIIVGIIIGTQKTIK